MNEWLGNKRRPEDEHWRKALPPRCTTIQPLPDPLPIPCPLPPTHHRRGAAPCTPPLHPSKYPWHMPLQSSLTPARRGQPSRPSTAQRNPVLHSLWPTAAPHPCRSPRPTQRTPNPPTTSACQGFCISHSRIASATQPSTHAPAQGSPSAHALTDMQPECARTMLTYGVTV